MYFRACARMGIFTLVCLTVASVFAQPTIIQTLFDQAPGLRRGVNSSLVLNTTATQALARGPEHVLLRNFPLANGGYAGFELEPARIFSNNARMTIVSASGTTSSMPLPEVRAWHGRESGGGERSLFLTQRSDGSLGAMVTGDPHTSDSVVMPLAGGSEYAIRAAELPAREYCGVGDMVPSDFASMPGDSAITVEEPGTAALGTGTRQVEIMLDISYSTYQKLGSDPARVTDYVTQLMGTVANIYRRDIDVQLVVSNLYVWSTPDPFNSDQNANGRLDTGDQLNLYRTYLKNNRGTVDRDLAHLVNYNRGLGGVAYVNVLCYKDYGLGVSNVYADLTFPPDINTYYWDTMVVAHEMGHNFGSPHTHCYPEPLDCCVTDPNCSGCATATPSAGTIMSYCHLQISRGGSVMMKFHERVITEIRARVDASACLAPFVGAPRLEVAGENGTVIESGDMYPETSDGTEIASAEAASNFITQYFIVGNPGSEELVFTNMVAVEGSRQFTISQQPLVNKLAPGEANYFAVDFDSSVAGVHDATIIIQSSDPATPEYRFAIRATAEEQESSTSLAAAEGWELYQ